MPIQISVERITKTLRNGKMTDTDWRGDDESSEDEPTVACPYCERQVIEGSPRCPYCERYISEEDAPAARKPWWIIIGALLCLYAVYRWIVE